MITQKLLNWFHKIGRKSDMGHGRTLRFWW